jgi:UDP-N-acetylmuramoylalanine--D-glutamate ligase
MSEIKLLEHLQKLVEGRKILILGFGREGKSTCRMLLKCGGYEELWIADQNPVGNVEGADGYICGENYQKSLNAFDVVFKSPGVVLEQEIGKYSCVITSQMEVFYETYRRQIVGVTGTKGKSTTSTLIYHILLNAGRSTVIAGNIGIPVFDIAQEIEPDTAIVCEMSSHQLEFMNISPLRGVYLNIHEEHLDHYGTMEKYVAAKENIYRYMQEGDLLICNAANAPADNECEADVVLVSNDGTPADICVEDDTIFYGSRSYHIPMDKIALIGKHSQFNIAVAYGVCDSYGISDEEFEQGLVTYQILPHRLEYFGTYGGVKYYDDSISTICDSVIQALESIKDVSSIILGGMDRGIDYTDLIQALSRDKVENIILMEATGKRIYEEITENYPEFVKPERLHLTEHLEDAVELAAKITTKGMSCVLSPAAASYGIFKNFEERGDRFKEIVKKIQ